MLVPTERISSVAAICGAAAAVPAAVTWQGATQDTSNATTYTFTSVAIGAASADRDVIVGVYGGATTARIIYNVTIGGANATPVRTQRQSSTVADIWYVNVPTGTTATIVVTWSGSQDRCEIGVWTTNVRVIPTDHTGTLVTTTANGNNVSVNTVATGFVVAIGSYGNVTVGTLVARNMTSQIEHTLEVSTTRVMHADATATGGAMSVGIDLNGGSTAGNANSPMAVASFEPVGTPAGTFVPTDLGATTQLWLDFSDTGTITDAGSGAVSQVTDKSGSGHTVTQGTGAARPTTGVATVNSLNALRFDGGDSLTRTGISGTLPSNNTGGTLFVVRKYSSGTGGGLMMLKNNASAGESCSIGRDGGNSGAWGNNTSSSVGIQAVYADSDNTNWHVVAATYETALRAAWHDSVRFGVNGSNVNTCTTTEVAVGFTNPINHTGTTFFNGDMAAVVVISGVNVGHRLKIEGWAAWKYGIQASLPTTHPYYGAAP